MDLNQFTTALHQHLCTVATSHDNKQLLEVSRTLKQQFYSNPLCVPSLLQIAVATNEIPANVRQLAAVEGRKSIKNHWKKLNPETQKFFKEKILECVISEPDNRVQQSLTHMVAQIGKKELRRRRWVQLVDALMNGCQSPEVRVREVCFLIFREVITEIALHYEESRVLPVFQHISTHLADVENPQIQLLALETLCHAACVADRKNVQSTHFLQNIVPQLIQVLNSTLTQIESAKRAFEGFDLLLSSNCPILNPHFLPFVHFLVEIFKNTSHQSEIRVLAGNVIVLLPMYKSKVLKKQKLIEPILDSILPLTIEASIDEEDMDTPGSIALRIVHSFSAYLNVDAVFATMTQKLTTMAQDPNPLTRTAAIRCLGLTVESFADQMQPQLENFTQLLCHQLMDAHPAVRKVTCDTVVQFIEVFETDIVEYHAQLLPCLLECVKDPISRTMATSAIDTLLEIMEAETVKPYLPTLVSCLLTLLQDPDIKIRQEAISALGSVAHSAGEAFRPFFPHIFPSAFAVLQLSNEANADEMLLRGMGIDTMSAIANAVGPDVFREHVMSVCTLIVESMNMKAPKLKECAFCFFGVLSGTFKREFSPFLGGLVPALFQSVLEDEAIEFPDENGEEDVAAQPLRLNAGEDNDEEDIDSDDNDEEIDLDGNDDDDDVNVGMLAEEKATAIDVLGDLFESTQQDFLPYLDESVKNLLSQSSHYSDDVRKNIMLVFCKFIQQYITLSLEQSSAIPQSSVAPFTANLMNTILSMLVEEEESTVVSEVFDALQGLVRTLKASVLEQDPTHVERLCQIILSIFNASHVSQQRLDRDDDLGEDPEDEDISSSIFESDYSAQVSACDLVAALAHGLGNRMTSYITVFLPEIIKAMESVEEGDLSSMLGSLADMCVGLKSGVNACVHFLLPLFQSAMAHKNQEIASNSAFGVGVLVEHCDMALDESSLIQALVPMLQSSLPQCIDNACGALSRILYKKQELLFHSQILPPLLDALPLRDDFQENEPVFKLLHLLLCQHFATCAPYLPKIMHVFAHALLKPEERLPQPELFTSTVNLLRSLFNPVQAGVQESVQPLPSEMQAALQKVLYQ